MLKENENMLVSAELLQVIESITEGGSFGGSLPLLSSVSQKIK